MRILLILLVCTPVFAKPNIAVMKDITEAAKLAKVDPQLLLAVCFVESSFRGNLKPHMDGTTHSHGVCQVKLETAQHMDSVYKLKIKATEKRLQVPFVNAYYAGLFLRYQMNRYKNWQSAVESYNKGHATNGDGVYVSKVFKAYKAMPVMVQLAANVDNM
jgi:soluble lytic murein transglycosylase-like protein